MCKVTVVNNPIVSIQLNLDEAEYIQNLLQNAYMYPQAESEVFSQEPKSESDIRIRLYTELKKAIFPFKPTELR